MGKTLYNEGEVEDMDRGSGGGYEEDEGMWKKGLKFAL